jgi:predicted CopG family antitoxin
MASKLVSIRNDVLEQLLKLKHETESFSDVILRLIQTHTKNPLQHFGIGKDDDDLNDLFENAITTAKENQRINQARRIQRNWSEDMQ